MGAPRGRDEIVAAVITAATALFAGRGPAAVSLREVAREAGVTLSQIHRHIGNKEQLLAAVLAADAERPAGRQVGEDGPDDLATFLKALFRLDDASVRTRLQARTVLDGYDLPSLQRRYPGIELAAALLAERVPEEQARARAALLATFFAGWQLLGPTYLQITGGDDLSPERLARAIAPVLEAIAEAPAAPD